VISRSQPPREGALPGDGADIGVLAAQAARHGKLWIEERGGGGAWTRFCKGKEVLCAVVCWTQKVKSTMCSTQNQEMECVVHRDTL
jgi:hypothetical protein